MKKATYTPHPVNTSDITIPKELLSLTEKIAKNTHEVWSANRIADGWTWGPVRDDAKKQHPCLVPYEDLPETEKEYDRSTSLETIKLILSFGYMINLPTM